MREKRIHPRFGPLVIKTAFTVGADRGEGYLTNVSEGGAFLAVDDPPPLGAEVEIRAILPWRLGELCAGTRVAWRSKGGSEGSGKLSGVGLAFEELDPKARELLDAYLDKFTELAARIEELEEG
jgi:Tfp pilus assembly protein PilZ